MLFAPFLASCTPKGNNTLLVDGADDNIGGEGLSGGGGGRDHCDEGHPKVKG